MISGQYLYKFSFETNYLLVQFHLWPIDCVLVPVLIIQVLYLKLTIIYIIFKI